MKVTQLFSKFRGYNQDDKIKLIEMFLSQNQCDYFSVRFYTRELSDKDVETYITQYVYDNGNYRIGDCKVSKEVLAEYFHRDCRLLVAEFTDYENEKE